MTVADTGVVDIVAFDKARPIVTLVVTDHIDWVAELDHLFLLQEKLNTYLAFVESGELIKRFPNALGRSVQIEVAFLHEPTEHARSHFLEGVEKKIRGAGFTFVWGTHEYGDVDDAG